MTKTEILDSVDLVEAKNEIRSLVENLNYHRDLYYNKSKPTISDAEYDARFDRLKELEERTGFILAKSPTQTVGFEVKSKLEKVKHNHPMLSLDKIHSSQEIWEFVQKNGDCVMSLKMDGLTMSLHYDENGDLISAETRGDGEVGEQVLHNAKFVSNIPLHINNNGVPFDIDGELICDYVSFNQFNESLPIDEEKYSHPRNFASGSIRLLDANESCKRPLSFVGWRVINGINSNSMEDRLCTAGAMGFDVVPYKFVCKNFDVEQIEYLMEQLQDMADICDYPIDGLVIVTEDIVYGDSLGLTGHHPRYGCAYKPPVEKVKTTITGITWKVGKTGVIAPRAEFKTVSIDGTDVSAATLHNLSYIEDMQIGIGSEVNVIKANLIIPKVIERCSKPVKYNYPKTCPCCGAPVEVRETQAKDEEGNDRTIRVLYCPNENCAEKNLAKFVQFVSKNGMDIDGLGPKQIKELIDLGYIHTFLDIYDLKSCPEIANISGWGTTSFKKMCKAIEASRHVKLENYLVALSIPNIGKSAAKTIAKHFKGNYNDFIVACQNNFDFTSLEDFGPKMNESLYTWFNQMDGLDKDLHKIMIFDDSAYNQSVTMDNSDNFCNGKTFVVTGAFHNYKRSEIEKIITDRGGKLSGSVSKKTNFLLTNETTGTTKYNKAMELGIPVMSEEEFCEKVGL